VPEPLTERASIRGIPYARVWLDGELTPFIESVLRDGRRELEALRSAGKPTTPLPPVHALAISGGGDAGAFAAGILCGWTASGNRPEFKVVTGISAGALIAPFAFLGAEYDEVVRTVATSAGPDDIHRRRNTLLGLASDGMASTEPLAKIVARSITPEILEAVAREYAKGRVLQIGTTNIDAGRQVTWNMGEIASSNAPGALDLFRQVMIASTCIPGVVSPEMIDVEVDGKHYQEMHVDGGVISQVFLYPTSFLNELRRTTGKPLDREFHAYVIRNGRLKPDWSHTKRRTLDIGGRAISALVHTQGINDVHKLYQIASNDKVDFNLAYIGEEFNVRHSQIFDTAYMRRLYEYGYQVATEGRQWHKVPPDTAPMS
jgi:predicted acylesterase/phospholipase RssA